MADHNGLEVNSFLCESDSQNLNELPKKPINFFKTLSSWPNEPVSPDLGRKRSTLTQPQRS